MSSKSFLQKLAISALFLILISAGVFLIKKTNEIQIFPGQKSEKKNNEKENIFDPGLLTWEMATSNAAWEARDSYSAIVFKDKLWLMGGLDGNDSILAPNMVQYWRAPHFSDVWASENGKDWQLITQDAPWGKRRSIQLAVFKDKLWLIGGWGPAIGCANDIWSSTDGINWRMEASNAAWQGREGHQLVVFKDKLWILGGVRYDLGITKNDVWYSEDGINWIQATSNAAWEGRWDHEVVEFSGKLWLLGGMDLNNKIYNDVWNSEDGISWTQVSESAPWQTRQGFGSVAYKNYLWVIGRFNDAINGGANDIWYSADGINWQKTKEDPIWLGREDITALVFQDKIWFFGGMDASWKWVNEVWNSNLAK
ncbi:MAG: galactose oxidase [Candidatus Pacebacteria bacterium]|nr:galactose oxidase [Candidatus Paceibacterota bacterium]